VKGNGLIGIVAGLVVAATAPLCEAIGEPDDGPRVEYSVRLPEPQTQMVEMTVVLRGLVGDSVDLCLPVWRPGRYVVLDPSGTVRGVRARAGDGRVLGVEKTDKATWRIATGGAAEVVVDYRVYANSLADRTRHVDDTHAFLSPSSVFMYAPALRGEPLEVHIDAPEGWRVATGLEADLGDERTLRAPSYDVLVDSPIEVGLQERAGFEVEGVPHEIAVWPGGRAGGEWDGARPKYMDLERWSADFARIVSAQRAVFGDLPYGRYVYLVHVCTGASGGTEHLNSTIMQAAPSRFHTEKSYRSFLSLVSHEMFHTWNVKRLRPAGLSPYDYQRENYTDLLWVAEGTTTYYEDLILVRAGLEKPDAYLKALGTSIDSLRRRPGARVQSVEESSFDAWVKHGRVTPDSANSTVSFYESGSLVSLALDMEVRRATGGAASLDDLMRDLYTRFPLDGPGYTRDDVIEAAQRLGFEGVSEFFARHVRGTEPIDFENLLAWVGLEVSRAKAGKGGAEGEGAEDETGDTNAYLGMNIETRDGNAVVAGVLSDGPAYLAGVLPGDSLVAVNGERVRGASWGEISGRLGAGVPVRLTLFRMDVLRELVIEPGGRPARGWSVSRVKGPSEAQRRAYASWLGQEWPAKKGKNADDGQGATEQAGPGD